MYLLVAEAVAEDVEYVAMRLTVKLSAAEVVVVEGTLPQMLQLLQEATL
jgi:hypothetical protein